MDFTALNTVISEYLPADLAGIVGNYADEIKLNQMEAHERVMGDLGALGERYNEYENNIAFGSYALDSCWDGGKYYKHIWGNDECGKAKPFYGRYVLQYNDGGCKMNMVWARPKETRELTLFTGAVWVN